MQCRRRGFDPWVREITISFLGVYPEENTVRKDAHTLMFTAALFTVVRTGS